MTDKIHKTQFLQDKHMPWKRPITISYIAGMGYNCDIKDCKQEADYMGGGRLCCTKHWTRGKE